MIVKKKKSIQVYRIPSTQDAEVGGSRSEAGPSKSANPISKTN
jgi:hypothetical protein